MEDSAATIRSAACSSIDANSPVPTDHRLFQIQEASAGKESTMNARIGMLALAFGVGVMVNLVPMSAIEADVLAACPNSECDIGNECRYHQGTYCYFGVRDGGWPTGCEERQCEPE
jgi:hypothetical protein